jgi:hypothetical protein
MVNHPNRGSRKAASIDLTKPTYFTSDKRASFANDSIAGLIRNFAIGDIRTVSICTVWSDGEVGGDYHIESASDKAKLIAQFERMLRILRGEEKSPPYAGGNAS